MEDRNVRNVEAVGSMHLLLGANAPPKAAPKPEGVENPTESTNQFKQWKDRKYARRLSRAFDWHQRIVSKADNGRI